MKKELADRLNFGKPKMSIIPYDPMTEVAKVLMFGAEKYSRNNWRKGLTYTSIIDSMERHIGAIKNGEDFDEESGLYHAAHVAANAIFFIQYMMDGMEFLDDRYKKGEHFGKNSNS